MNHSAGASSGHGDGKKLTYNPDGGFDFTDIGSSRFGLCLMIGIIDTHVGWRGRIGRMIALLNATKKNIGSLLSFRYYLSLAFGMDQNTAILCQFDYWTKGNQSVQLTVLGAEGVSVIRTDSASFLRNVRHETDPNH